MAGAGAEMSSESRPKGIDTTYWPVEMKGLSSEEVERWVQKREANLISNAERAEKRTECLQKSILAGSMVGAVTGCAAYRALARAPEFSRRLFLGGS